MNRRDFFKKIAVVVAGGTAAVVIKKGSKSGYKGGVIDLKKMRKAVRVNTDATLRKDDWKALDENIVKVARRRMRAIMGPEEGIDVVAGDNRVIVMDFLRYTNFTYHPVDGIIKCQIH